MLLEYLPAEAEDDDADWRTELVNRYATVTGFLELLAEANRLGCAWEPPRRRRGRRRRRAGGLDDDLSEPFEVPAGDDWR